MADKRAGADGARGNLFEVAVDRIKYLEPRAFILENVVGIWSVDSGDYIKIMLVKLEASGTYVVDMQTLVTCDHGLPQHRRKVYIVGWLRRVNPDRFFLATGDRPRSAGGPP